MYKPADETLESFPPIESLVARMPQHLLVQAIDTATQGLISAIRAREINTVSAAAAQQGLLQNLHTARLFYDEKALQAQVLGEQFR